MIYLIQWSRCREPDTAEILIDAARDLHVWNHGIDHLARNLSAIRKILQ